MKKTPLFFLSLLLAGLGYSQSLSPEVIASSGEHFSGANVELSWTIGEPMIETHVMGATQLTHGFHQTNLMVTALEDLTESFQVKVFPNPTTAVLNIECLANTEPFFLTLYDARGAQLIRQEVVDFEMSETLDLASFAAGSYYLHLSNQENKTIKTFKILKTH